jgi:hypothetical protein
MNCCNRCNLYFRYRDQEERPGSRPGHSDAYQGRVFMNPETPTHLAMSVLRSEADIWTGLQHVYFVPQEQTYVR